MHGRLYAESVAPQSCRFFSDLIARWIGPASVVATASVPASTGQQQFHSERAPFHRRGGLRTPTIHSAPSRPTTSRPDTFAPLSMTVWERHRRSWQETAYTAERCRHHRVEIRTLRQHTDASALASQLTSRRLGIIAAISTSRTHTTG